MTPPLFLQAAALLSVVPVCLVGLVTLGARGPERAPPEPVNAPPGMVGPAEAEARYNANVGASGAQSVRVYADG